MKRTAEQNSIAKRRHVSGCRLAKFDFDIMHACERRAYCCRCRIYLGMIDLFRLVPPPLRLCYGCNYGMLPDDRSFYFVRAESLKRWLQAAAAEWERKEKLYALRQCGFPLVAVSIIKRLI